MTRAESSLDAAPGRGFVFVLGTGRCGSTVVQELMARHRDVGFVSNVDTLLAPLDPKGRFNGALYRAVPGGYSRRDTAYLKHLRFTLAERMHFGPSEAYRLLSRQIAPLFSEPFRDLTEDDVTPRLERRFRSFFENRKRAQGRAVFLHKLTGWPRARFIHRIMPAARFIHVVRDGRAVANSLMQRPWWKGYLGPDGWGFGPLSPDDRRAWEATGRSFVALAGLEWKILVNAFRDAGSAIGPERWLDARYEDLVSDSRGSFARLLAFAGLEWDEDFEAQFRRHPFTTERTEAFRADLTPGQLAMLEELLRPELDRLGYATAPAAAIEPAEPAP
jgi:Sulfotransferase family